MRARKTSSSNIHVGQSIDQLIAENVGQQTKFSSLELTCDAIRKSGRCDSGYSCAYQYNLSWRTPVTPMTPEPNPRNVFERLFGDQDPKGHRQQQIRRNEQRSILDFVLEDAKQLRKQLGKADHRKVDEYMSGIRDIEQRIERMETFPTGKLTDFSVDRSIDARRDSTRLCRTHRRDVRTARSRVSDRYDTSRHVVDGSRRIESQLSPTRDSRRAPQPDAPTGRAGCP